MSSFSCDTSGNLIVPFAFVGGEEAYPVISRLEGVGKLVGAPFIPVPRHIVPIPVPISCQIIYGEPMYFEGDGSEADDVIFGYVAQVKARVAALIEEGRELRRDLFSGEIVLDDDDV